MTYAEYKEQEHNRVNDLPVFWAFSNDQCEVVEGKVKKVIL